MTDETSQTITTSTPQTFGNRLKSAREDLRLDLKDVASQLRLRVGIIEMLEKEMYSDDMPITFLRGYLRSYAKFLEIPDTELNSALSVEPFQPKQAVKPTEEQQHDEEPIQKFLNYADKSLNNVIDKKVFTDNTKQIVNQFNFFSRFFKRYFMTLVTCIIIFTLGYLVVTWWNSHKTAQVIAPLAEQEKTFVADNSEPVATVAIQSTQPAVAAPVIPAKPKVAPQVQAALPEPKFETLAEARNQDLEAADDEAVIFEDDAAPQQSIAAATTNQSSPVKDNKKIIDIYNE